MPTPSSSSSSSEGKSSWLSSLMTRLSWSNTTLGKLLLADVQMVFSAFFFGISFLGQKELMMRGMGIMTCNAIRFGISAIILLVCLPFLQNVGKDSNSSNTAIDNKSEIHESNTNISNNTPNNSSNHKNSSNGSNSDYDEEEDMLIEKSADKSKNEPNFIFSRIFGQWLVYFDVGKKSIYFWGIILGIINCGGSALQQWGISRSSAGKVGFISGFTIFLVPIFSSFMPTLKRDSSVKPTAYIAIVVSLLGLYSMSNTRMDDLFNLEIGETVTLIGCVFWTLHIIYTDLSTSYVDSIPMVCVQLAVVCILSSIVAFFFEKQDFIEQMMVYGPWMLFVSSTETAGFVLAALGQKYSPPTHASIILSLEGVFATFASYLVLHDSMAPNESLGCFLMLVATAIAKIDCGINKLFTRSTAINSSIA